MDIDAVLDPVIGKLTIKKGRNTIMKIGDAEVRRTTLLVLVWNEQHCQSSCVPATLPHTLLRDPHWTQSSICLLLHYWLLGYHPIILCYKTAA